MVKYICTINFELDKGGGFQMQEQKEPWYKRISP